jgi:nucleoside-diphosphate-sugar epimerase
MAKGAGGFVGGFLARWLAAAGYEVTAITRGAAETAGATEHLTWRRSDLLSPDALPSRFDALLHIAAEIPARCPDPAVLYGNNMRAAENVFEGARRAGAEAVVFTSSMSVYGTIDVPVVTETTAFINPDPYGRAKRDAEVLLEDFVARGLYSGLSIRLPGTVGKGSHHNFLSSALAKVLAGDAVDANNPDALFNNIVYVGDLARFLGAWVAHPRENYAVTNLAATEPLSIREVVALLFETAGRPENIRVLEGGKKPFLISLDRAQELGYRPSTVRESVRQFVRDSLDL